MNKIKVFLGGYINQTNAQNLNCLELAKHLNKDKFEIYTLKINHGDLGHFSIPDVKVFNCYYPVKITNYIAFFWGIYNADVAYLPRGNYYKYLRFLVKIFSIASFKQIERIIELDNIKGFSNIWNSLPVIRANYFFVNKTYPITNYMLNHFKDNFDFPIQDEVLPIPINAEYFKREITYTKNLTNVVFIGNDMRRKGVIDYIQLAQKFPKVTFNIIGSDNENIIKQYEGLPTNIEYHGMLGQKSISKIIFNCDINILPSRSEGFPKVIIETAFSGLPTITYGDYGANEWITNFENGFVGKTIEDLEKALNKYINDIDLLNSNKLNAQNLAQEFGAVEVTKKYEKVIEELYLEKHAKTDN